VGTPRPASTTATNGASAGTARPGSTVPRPGSTVPRPGSTVPRPGSTLPNKPRLHPGQGQVPVKVEASATIMRAGTPMNVDQVQQRGKKREREDGSIVGMNGVGGVNGVAPHSSVPPTGLVVPPAPATNGYINGNGIAPPKMAANAKAGTAGVRPRPIKKQRMVSCSSSFLLVIPSWISRVMLELSSTVVNGCTDLLNPLGRARTGEGCCRSCATADTARRVT